MSQKKATTGDGMTAVLDIPFGVDSAFGKGAPQSAVQVVTSGNLTATVSADGRIVFSRVSDGKPMFAVGSPTFDASKATISGLWHMGLTTTVAEHENVYGLGQVRDVGIDRGLWTVGRGAVGWGCGWIE